MASGLAVAATAVLGAPGAGLVGALPLCGTFGLTAVLAAMAGGAPTVLLEAIDAARIAGLLRERRFTHIYGSDEMYRRLREAAPGRRPFPAARIFGYAAFQPGSAAFAREAWDDGVPILGLYGSSEVQALFSIQSPSATAEERAEGGGHPAAPDAEVRIRDVESGRLLPPGEIGEIEIRAPGNFVGYLDDPQATAEAVHEDGFFRTGDIGRLREDGSFVYLTRRGDAIRLGGFLVNRATPMPALPEPSTTRTPFNTQLDRQVWNAARCSSLISPVSCQPLRLLKAAPTASTLPDPRVPSQA